MPANSDFERFPFDPGRLPFFYGYVVVGLSVMGMLMSLPGQTMGVSAFTDHLIEGLRISRVQLATAYMAGTLTSSALLTWAGRLYDRFGARVMTAAAAIGLALSLTGLSAAGSGIAVGRAANLPFAGVAVMGLGFFMIRFFGQGMLTMSSRNMLMQWFETRRGLVNGVGGVFTAFGFNLSPVLLNGLISRFGWQGAWRVMALGIGVAFTAVVLVFFRDTPEGCGLRPDGRVSEPHEDDSAADGPSVGPGYTLAQARRTYSFWVFICAFGLLGLYYTAFTFHVASLFELAGRTRAEAFAVFFPATVISVTVSFIAGWASDRVPLKVLLTVMLTGAIVSCVGLGTLRFPWGKVLLIVGNGVAMGHFGLLGGITWPTFFGRRHMGEISGFNMAAMVFGSALGPWLFSVSLDHAGSYAWGIGACAVASVALWFAALRADRPPAMGAGHCG